MHLRTATFLLWSLFNPVQQIHHIKMILTTLPSCGKATLSGAKSEADIGPGVTHTQTLPLIGYERSIVFNKTR